MLPNSFGADWQQLILRRAVDEARTRDPQLGKLMLYQLSYYRSFSFLITGTNVEVFFLLYKLLPYFYHIEKS